MLNDGWLSIVIRLTSPFKQLVKTKAAIIVFFFNIVTLPIEMKIRKLVGLKKSLKPFLGKNLPKTYLVFKRVIN